MRWILHIVWGSALLSAVCTDGVAQQERITEDDVGRIYAEARFQKAYESFISIYGAAVVPRNTEVWVVPSDSLGEWIRGLNPDLIAEAPDTFVWRGQVEHWDLITPDERLASQERFTMIEWAYLGTHYFTALDTVPTPEIRARMEQYFGPPTKTLAEQDFRNGDNKGYVQFEYWFMVNDSIPLMVMDINGPFDRGVLVAGDYHYRGFLYRLRQSLLGPIMFDVSPAPHVDYYYNTATSRWYRTGFNGEDYFLRHIRQPNLARERPKVLPTDR